MAQMLKNLPAIQENLGSIPVLGRSPGEGNGNRLQYSCLEKPMDRGAWRAAVHTVEKSWTRLKQLKHMRDTWRFSGQPASFSFLHVSLFIQPVF